MKITSPEFENNTALPAKYTCDGNNVNPELHFHDIPADAKSLVLILEDPDAPGSLFTHWIMWNIDPTTSKIGEDSKPKKAIEGMNDFRGVGYGGPCPPTGEHRYVFRLYALSEPVELSPSADRTELNVAMSRLVLDHCELMTLYTRDRTLFD